MAAEKVNKAVQSMLVKLPNIFFTRLKQDEFGMNQAKLFQEKNITSSVIHRAQSVIKRENLAPDHHHRTHHEFAAYQSEVAGGQCETICKKQKTKTKQRKLKQN